MWGTTSTRVSVGAQCGGNADAVCRGEASVRAGAAHNRAEQLAQRPSAHPSTHPSIHPPTYPPTHPGPIWQDYIAFLSGAKPGTPAYNALWTIGMVGGQEDATRTAALRWVQRLFTQCTHNAGTRHACTPLPHTLNTQCTSNAPPTPRRRVFQRAIAVPTHSLELLWKQYETFEMGQV